MNKRLLCFLSGITVLRLVYAAVLPIAPQEAYYWNYSRHPALSYFDHPPMTAYLIKLTTLLGSSSFSVHLAAILLSVLMSLAIYKLAESLFDDKTAFWGVVAINLAFIYALGSLIITPDVPMMLFWVLGMIACHKITKGGGIRWWILLGIFLGAGFDSKYTMVFAALGVVLFFLFSRERLRYFFTPGPYIAFIFAFAAFLPVLVWNYRYDWASFLFQTGRRAQEMTEFRPDFFFGFIGTIIGIYGIVTLPMLIVGMLDSIKRAIAKKETRHALLIWFSLPLLLFLLPVAARSWVKMNWTAPAFIGLFVAGAAYYQEYSTSKKWVRIWGKVSVAFLGVSFIVVHVIFILPGIYLGEGDYTVGWNELASKVDSSRAGLPQPHFICGYEYKIASMLAFHLPGHPETVSNNIVGRPGLQFDFWADPDTLIGYNAIFIYDDRVAYKTPERLSSFFDSVASEEILTVKKGGKKLADFHIFICYGYKGPIEVNK